MKIAAFLLSVVLLSPLAVFAREVPTRYTNTNIETSRHEKPATFYVERDGALGKTESGRRFYQYAVAQPYGVRMHRFEIDDAFWYISDRGIIWADSDIIALSIYLSRA